MESNVRKITDGAMMTAVVGLLMLVNRQLGSIVELFVWVLPLPMVFFTAKYGWKDGLLPLTAMIFLTLLLGTPQSIYYFAVTACTGLIYGEGVRRKWSLRRLMLVAILISVISNLVTTVLFASFFGYDITTGMQSYQQMFEQAFGSSLTALPVDIGKIIQISIIFGVFFSGILEGVLIHMLSRLLLHRLGFQIPKPKPISQIVVPKWTGYVAIVLWAGSELFMKTSQTEQALEIVLIVDILANLYLLYFGYLGAMVFGAWKFNKNIMVYLVLISLFLLPIALPAIAMFGFLYITTNWRKDLLRRVHSGQTK